MAMPAAQFKLVCGFSAVLETDTFTANGDRLRSARANILENAVDACLEKGHAAPQLIQLRACLEDNDIVFEIEDNGIGMATG